MVFTFLVLVEKDTNMKNFDWKIINGFTSTNLIWIRIYGLKHGISLTRKTITIDWWKIKILKAKGA